MNTTDHELQTRRIRRVRAIFERVDESATTAAASAILDVECAGDAALRQQVEALLRMASDEGAGCALLDRPLMVPFPVFPELAPGDRAGRYRIVHEIGCGGMGTVYQVVLDDDAVTSPRYALKLVRWQSPEFVERLRQEARILSCLEHPHIARLLDAGVTDAGAPFLVMEFVEGKPLQTAAVGGGGLPVFRQICSAVEYLHRHLVIHRDLKPANLLVTAEGHVKVVDFGIASLLDATSAAVELSPLTPAYASPEQRAGLALTTSTDVYSLGVILREIAGPGPDADLAAIVAKATEHDPAMRYASVAHLDDDVERYLTQRPVLARDGSALYRTAKFIARNRIAALAGIAVALAIGGGMAATVRSARIAGQERQRAEQSAREADRMRRNAERSEADALRRLGDLERLANGAAHAYEARSRGDSENAGRLLAESVHDSLLRLRVEGRLAQGLAPLLDQTSADLKNWTPTVGSDAMAAPAGWRLWTTSSRVYSLGFDSAVRYQNKPALAFRSATGDPSKGGIVLTQAFNADEFRKKRVRLSVELKASQLVGQGTVTIYIAREGGDLLRSLTTSGTHDWERREAVFDVPSDSRMIQLLAGFNGRGALWVGGLDFAVVGDAVPLTEPQGPRNLDFSEKDGTK